MKLGGSKLEGPRIETVVIPFNGKDLVFKAQLVRGYDDFEKMCPLPTPPQILKPGGIKSYDTEDSSYKLKLKEYSNLRSDWLILKSLSVTPNLEWETVDMSKPETWKNFHTELGASGLSAAERSRIIEVVLDANGLDQSKIDEATKRFLMEEAAKEVQSSQTGAVPSMPSGKPANG